MLFASYLQIIGIKGLIDDNRIASVIPGAHHRRRNVTRARPHRDANVHGLNSQAAKPRVQRVEDNVFHLGQVDRLLRRRWSAAAGAVPG